MSACSEVPDLLRRFVPMPHGTRIRIDDIDIVAQSNDADLIAALQRVSGAGNGGRSIHVLHASIVRDHDAPCEVSDTRIISVPPLETLLIGTGSCLTLDCERCEILGFLAPAVSAQTFADVLLPGLVKVLRRTESAQAPSGVHQ